MQAIHADAAGEYTFWRGTNSMAGSEAHISLCELQRQGRGWLLDDAIAFRFNLQATSTLPLTRPSAPAQPAAPREGATAKGSSQTAKPKGFLFPRRPGSTAQSEAGVGAIAAALLKAAATVKTTPTAAAQLTAAPAKPAKRQRVDAAADSVGHTKSSTDQQVYSPDEPVYSPPSPDHHEAAQAQAQPEQGGGKGQPNPTLRTMVRNCLPHSCLRH